MKMLYEWSFDPEIKNEILKLLSVMTYWRRIIDIVVCHKIIVWYYGTLSWFYNQQKIELHKRTWNMPKISRFTHNFPDPKLIIFLFLLFSTTALAGRIHRRRQKRSVHSSPTTVWSTIFIMTSTQSRKNR